MVSDKRMFSLPSHRAPESKKSVAPEHRWRILQMDIYLLAFVSKRVSESGSRSLMSKDLLDCFERVGNRLKVWSFQGSGIWIAAGTCARCDWMRGVGAIWPRPVQGSQRSYTHHKYPGLPYWHSYRMDSYLSGENALSSYSRFQLGYCWRSPWAGIGDAWLSCQSFRTLVMWTTAPEAAGPTSGWHSCGMWLEPR